MNDVETFECWCCGCDSHSFLRVGVFVFFFIRVCCVVTSWREGLCIVELD